MSELNKKKLNYLNEKELIELYELFFGAILIKKPGFSYLNNLTKCLSKENFVQSILEKLNTNELQILKILSKNIIVPYQFILEKLNIILDTISTISKKSLYNLIEKKYIFLRDDSNLIIPNVFFNEYDLKIDHVEVDRKETPYNSKSIVDINNILLYFISKEIKHSNSYTLYKKDFNDIFEIFNQYSLIKNDEFDIVTYFYAIQFIDDSGDLILDNVKKYFKLNYKKQILKFIQVVYPWFYSIIKHFHNKKQSIKINKEEFKELWLNSFLLTEYSNCPIKTGYKETIEFLFKTDLLIKEDGSFVIPYYNDDDIENNNNIRLSSSFNLYINADHYDPKNYLPALFADFIKYNKIIEYEISETSIKRGVIKGLTLETVTDYFKKYDIDIPNNVYTTIKQWFDKYASFFYSTGIHFFCSTKEKGKIINKLIQNGMVTAFEIKENEVFLIPETEEKKFFDFLENSGINFFNKKPKKVITETKDKILNIKHFFNV